MEIRAVPYYSITEEFNCVSSQNCPLPEGSGALGEDLVLSEKSSLAFKHVPNRNSGVITYAYNPNSWD